MLNGKFVDSGLIIENVYREYGFEEDLTISDALEWIWRVINLIGVPQAYIQRTTNGTNGNPDPILIERGRGELPSDLRSIILARDYDTKMPMICQSHAFLDENYVDVYESQFTYRLDDNFIYTSFTDGEVELLYKAFPTSPLGLPLIPDDEKFILAVTTYIAYMLARKARFRGDQFPRDLYEELKQEYMWYIGASKTKAQIPSIDQMEGIKNRWLRLKQNPDLHDTSFRYISDKERLILHNNTQNYPGGIRTPFFKR